MKIFQPQTLIIILAIVMIIFGPKQLPELGKALGKTMKSIRDGMEGDNTPQDGEAAAPAEIKKADGEA